MSFYLKGIVKHVHPQPYILAIGSRLNPLQVFVIVERRAVGFETMTKAVDYCFKLLYVLDVEYQPSCYAAWECLQSCVYDIPNCDSKPVGSSVRELNTFLSSATLSG